MRPDRAWVRLGSGRRLDLLDPQPHQWTGQDLAVGLSRTYRWGGHSRWDLPMSVAQHSLLVLVLRQQMQPHRRLTPREALREALHDGEEALCGGLGVLTSIKPCLGSEFRALTARLRPRYGSVRLEGIWCRRLFALTRPPRKAAPCGVAIQGRHCDLGDPGWPCRFAPCNNGGAVDANRCWYDQVIVTLYTWDGSFKTFGVNSTVDSSGS